jgi:hypothetical protein
MRPNVQTPVLPKKERRRRRRRRRRKLQIKATMRYHYIPIRMVTIQNTDNSKC